MYIKPFLLFWVLMLVVCLAEADNAACTAGDDALSVSASCAAPEASSSADAPAKNSTASNKLHLAGFLPDGYFTRARERMAEAKMQIVLGGEFEITELGDKREFQAFVARRFKNQAHGSSTIVWLEEPLEILGDSDDLEKFYLDCVLGGESNDESTPKYCRHGPRGFARYRNRKVIAMTEQEEQEGKWEHEAHQGVKCTTTTISLSANQASLSTVHVILNREWDTPAFQALSQAIKQSQLYGDVQVGKSSVITVRTPFMTTFTGSLLSPQQKVRLRQRGTVSTNGAMLRITIRNNDDGEDMTGFVPCGYIPEGDMLRTVDGWVARMQNNSKISVNGCKFLFGGMRRVQSILAMDRVEASS